MNTRVSVIRRNLEFDNILMVFFSSGFGDEWINNINNSLIINCLNRTCFACVHLLLQPPIKQSD